MAKIDKSLYTKTEFRRLQQEKKIRKLSTTTPTSPYEFNLVCLKHGEKYSANYVNVLYNMVSRNTKKAFKFYCLTDNPKNIIPQIICLPLPTIPKLQGWWYKPYIFSKQLPLTGIILYLDLDLVITGNIDNLVNYKPNQFCIIRDFARSMRPNWSRFNSSVMKFQAGTLDYVWRKFIDNASVHMRRFHGDQDFIYAELAGVAETWPDNWIKSWKWEIRASRTFAPGGLKGNRKFAEIEHVVAPDDCAIAVFHGDPNPHNCDDPFIKEKWK